MKKIILSKKADEDLDKIVEQMIKIYKIEEKYKTALKSILLGSFLVQKEREKEKVRWLLKEIEEEIRRLELKLDWIYYRWKPSFQRFKNPKPKKEEPEINWLINDQTMFGVSGALKALKFSKTLIKKTFSGMVEE